MRRDQKPFHQDSHSNAVGRQIFHLDAAIWTLDRRSAAPVLHTPQDF